MTIRRLSSREVYRNRWMTVREDQVERANGARGIFGVVEKFDSAIIIPMDDDSVYLVEQFRYPIGRTSLEFPQGSWEQNGIDPLEIARGELQEETGIEAEHFEHLGEIAIAIGYSNQKTDAFLATTLTLGKSMPDMEEHDIILRRCSVAELEELLRRNVIKDAQTLAAWALFQARRKG